MSILLLLFFLVVSTFAQFPQKLLRIYPQNQQEFDHLEHIVEEENVVVWKDPTSVGFPVDLVVEDEETLKTIQSQFELVETLIDDLAPLWENQFDGQSRQQNDTSFLYLSAFECYDTYLSYANIRSYLTSLVARAPTIARTISIGRSLNNQEIVGVQISVSSGSAKRGIYIDSAIHAREWIAPAVNLNILLNLIAGYESRDAQVLDLLSKFDVTIIPVLNVDGYTFTWTNNRQWRKTRRANSDGSFGVDMNRNADVLFCQRGASSTPSSDTYCGPYANSEPELVNTFNYIRTLNNVLVYWNLHSYGQEIILPWAYDNSIVTPDRADHLRAGNLLWEGIYAATGLQYDRPRPPNGVYSGFAIDKIYRDLRVKYPGLIELRDTGRYGFALPESQICPNSLEIWTGFLRHALYAYSAP